MKEYLKAAAAVAAISLMWFSGYPRAQTGDVPKKEAAATIPPAAGVGDSTTTAAHKVIAYYFHSTARCTSCRKIEAYTHESILTNFDDDLQSGRLEWRVLNTDFKENRHFIKDYQLYTKSVVLVDLHDGKQIRWKNLSRVWELLGDKPAFLKYVQSEVNAYLTSD